MYILFTIAALLSLAALVLLYSPISLNARVHNFRGAVSIRYLFVTAAFDTERMEREVKVFRRPVELKRKKDRVKKKEKRGKKRAGRERAGKPREKLSPDIFWRNRQLILKYLQLVEKRLPGLVRCIECRRADLRLVLASEDPAYLGWASGVACWLETVPLPRAVRWRFVPDFTGEETDFTGDVDIILRPYRPIIQMMLLLLSIPKIETIRFIRNLRKRR